MPTIEAGIALLLCYLCVEITELYGPSFSAILFGSIGLVGVLASLVMT